MIKFNSLFAGLLLTVMAGAANAHSEHSHMDAITSEQAAAKAGEVVQHLVTTQKLASSWQGVQAKESVVRDLSGGTAWVVSYENPQETDAARKVLYVYLDEMGNVIDATHQAAQ